MMFCALLLVERITSTNSEAFSNPSCKSSQAENAVNLQASLSLSLSLSLNLRRLWLWSKSHYKCFEAFDGLIRRKNFTNWPIEKRFKTFAASRWPYPYCDRFRRVGHVVASFLKSVTGFKCAIGFMLFFFVFFILFFVTHKRHFQFWLYRLCIRVGAILTQRKRSIYCDKSVLRPLTCCNNSCISHVSCVFGILYYKYNQI